MKKLLSLALSALMLASALASCAPATDRLDPAITIASSDAAEYATWLGDRLGTVPNEITLGIGSNDAHGIDMTEFADDGYILRSIGDEVVAFGKTADGLDRAVRAYAKAVEAGQTTEFDTVYNEGPRVKRLTIAGRDISEYSIRVAADADECHTFAASELQSFIGKACGFYPEIVTEDRAHMIVLEQVLPGDERYESLNMDGFIFTVKENGDLYISGGQYRGCLYGVYEFLEKYIGWRFLYDYFHYSTFTDKMDGCIDYLYEAEHIDIPADLNETQSPAFITRLSVRAGTLDYAIRRKYNYSLPTKYGNNYGVPHAACHGLMKGPYEDFVDYDPTYMTQPCFTNEDNIDIACEYYADYCRTRIDAGQTVGKELVDVDISQNDNSEFCTCKECLKLFKSEGGFSGPMLHFSNLVADAVAEVDPDIYVLVLVYAGTTSVPKNIRPRDNVSPAYCFYGDPGALGCYSHSVNGYDCAGTNHIASGGRPITNERFGAELRAWNEVSNRIQIWYYPGIWNSTSMSSPFLHRVYEDMKFFLELENVAGIYLCPSGCNVSSGYIRPEEMAAQYVIPEMAWDGVISYEEYLDLISEYYYIMCGDGNEELMRYYFDLQIRCAATGCWGTNAFASPMTRIVFSEIRKNFDDMVDVFDTAKRLAQTKRQEDYVELLSQTMYFTGLCASHTEWYLEGDEESRAKYEKYFDEFKTVALEHGFDFYGYDEQHVFIKEEDFDIEQNIGRLIRNDVTDYSLSEDWYLHE